MPRLFNDADERKRAQNRAACRRWRAKNLEAAREADRKRKAKKYLDPEFREKKVCYYRRRRVDDAERVKTIEAAWYEENRERLSALKRLRVAANRERVNALKRAWYAANKDRINARRRRRAALLILGQT